MQRKLEGLILKCAAGPRGGLRLGAYLSGSLDVLQSDRSMFTSRLFHSSLRNSELVLLRVHKHPLTLNIVYSHCHEFAKCYFTNGIIVFDTPKLSAMTLQP